MASLVEQQYHSRIDTLTPKERVARSVAMLKWTRDLLARQVTAEQGPMSEERLKWEVAKRLYVADPAAIALIEREMANVSG